MANGERPGATFVLLPPQPSCPQCLGIPVGSTATSIHHWCHARHSDCVSYLVPLGVFYSSPSPDEAACSKKKLKLT